MFKSSSRLDKDQICILNAIRKSHFRETYLYEFKLLVPIN
ncbi:hypothetical protein VCR15J2_330027 [Vibrio coralliirubri]|nr:hypothetical protein VCR15J2_330027 [Vibrio coralliirubri]